MSTRHISHVDDDRFVTTHHNVARVQVEVHQSIGLRNRVEPTRQQGDVFLRQHPRKIADVIAQSRFEIRTDRGIRHFRVEGLRNLGQDGGKAIHLFGVLPHQRAQLHRILWRNARVIEFDDRFGVQSENLPTQTRR